MHISHNTPCLPPKILHKHCLLFQFSWDHCNTHQKLKTKVMQSFGGQTRFIMGDVQIRMGSFGIDWYIREDLRYSNYWFAADITTIKLTVS